ncbi:valine--tRNA ligase [Candidatus Saccharibacteria bacterium]|nr:valine--tRNA ligase [Candidatus Saccharibacteria bacterium]
MKFASSYEPNQYESDIYAAWEAAGVFKPTIPTIPVDDNGDGVDDRFEAGAFETVLRRREQEERSAAHDDGPAQARRESTASNLCYSIVMPPPNANGNLHIGHGLTVALEDSLTRYYRLKGASTWYIPGADHAGFETWVVYEKNLEKSGHTRFEYSRDELYSRVWDFVQMQRGNMELQLRALGASCSWDDLTFTLDENVIDRVYTTFEKMWNDGMIYRGEKLVNYCPKHQTAFADIEVDHKDEKGTLWELAYDDIIVSTTRPETLFGDTAVAVNPEDERYKDMIGKTVHLPLTDREIPVIADEHADPEYGTGAVKITPAHDFDDFEVGNRHNLERIQVISEDGHMINVPEKYLGLTTEECRKQVLKDLKDQGILKGEKKIVHSVAHCYKCDTVLEPMLKEQWFVDVEKLAKMAIEHLENDEIKFYPDNKKRVVINYLKNLKDWNISRQIPWGIAIPMFKKVTEEATDEPDWIFDRRTNLTEIEKSGTRYVRDEDTFDTWFSSSHWPIVCTDWSEENPTPYYPLNVMETAGDILFAWVARMIMMGVYVTGEVPFKEVYLHGLVLDEHGQKMSKSKGNVINPMDLVEKYGSDAFRLGILRGRSAGMNQAFSENSVIAGRNLCNKLWNISRLVQSIVDEEFENSATRGLPEATAEDEGASPVTLAPWDANCRRQTGASDPSRESTISNSLYTTDNMGEDWICREINECTKQIEQDMKDYRFAEAVETLYQTIWDKYADWFLESQKIYRNAALLKATLEHLLIILHPFAPFVTETIWQNLSWTEGFIITQKWPSRLNYDPITAEQFESILTIVSEVRGTLQALPGTNNANKYALMYDNDSLVEDNLLLIKALTKVPDINALDGKPRGLRLALANHELYLDVPEQVVAEYKDALTEKILSVGRELDALNARMMNPNYVEKAPEHLVKETKDQIKEKEALIDRLKTQQELI